MKRCSFSPPAPSCSTLPAVMGFLQHFLGLSAQVHHLAPVLTATVALQLCNLQYWFYFTQEEPVLILEYFFATNYFSVVHEAFRRCILI